MTTAMPSVPAKQLSARDRRIQKVHEMALKVFRNHVLTLNHSSGLHRHWTCRDPDSWNCSFHVVMYPGGVMITGDLGFLAVERTSDMLFWLDGAIDSIEYFAEKVPREIPTTEYDPNRVKEWLDELERDLAEQEKYAGVDDVMREKIADLLELDYDNEHETMQGIHDSGLTDGGDWPDFNNYTLRFLWLREALKWFIEHLPQDGMIAGEGI